jgi:DNA replication protein DnaC
MDDTDTNGAGAVQGGHELLDVVEGAAEAGPVQGGPGERPGARCGKPIFILGLTSPVPGRPPHRIEPSHCDTREAATKAEREAEEMAKAEAAMIAEILGNYPAYAASMGISPISIPADLKTMIADDDSLEGIQAAKTFISAGGFLTLYGSTGTGKTWIAAGLARALILAGGKVNWQRMVDLLSTIRADLKIDEGRQTLRSYKRGAVLVLDDLGSERPTDWTNEVLFDLLDYRYNYTLPTVITTNLDGPGIGKTYGVRIVSRLKGAGPIIELKGRDRRLKVSGLERVL